MISFPEAEAKALMGKRVKWKGRSPGLVVGRVAHRIKLQDGSYDLIVRWPKGMLGPDTDATIEQFDKKKFKQYLRIVTT